MNKCKNCGKENNNGTNFCTRKCRKEWIKKHEIKGAKKKAQKRDEYEAMSWCPKFDSDGNSLSDD